MSVIDTDVSKDQLVSNVRKVLEDFVQELDDEFGGDAQHVERVLRVDDQQWWITHLSCTRAVSPHTAFCHKREETAGVEDVVSH